MVNKKQPPTACFCNGALTDWFKVLSSFHNWFRGTGRGFRKAPLQKHKRYAQCRATATVLRTLALLLAALSRATPKQAKEPIISTNDIEKLDFIRVNKLALSNEIYDYKK